MLKKSHIKTLLVSTTDNGEDIIRPEADGGGLIDESGQMLRYAERDNDGTASLLLTDGFADLKRNGRIKSRMTFVDGKLVPCAYTTPNGALDFSLYTHSTLLNVTPEGGRFEARYTMLAAGKQVADNVLTVEWQFTN